MPFYEYKCGDCGAEFETFVKTISAPVPQCPECHGKKVARTPSVFGVSSSQPSAGPSPACPSCHQSDNCPYRSD
jgi:putative FmdB family regulatory protein